LTVQASLRPRGPYDFALTVRGASDATRVVRDGVLTALVHGRGGPERTLAWQTPDGLVHVRAETDEGLERVRFALAVDADHSPFLRRFRSDPLLREATWHLRGLRVVRAPTVALALLRALCGQLIESRRAREIERRIVRATTARVEGLQVPPVGAELGALAPARLRALGLHARRAATLVRLCGSLDLERLHGVPTDGVAARLERERGLGPWSVGVVCLEGLGRPERGLVGDLGLVKLCSALRGRWVDAAETAELLEPYGEWAGLASAYLLAGFSRGLIPIPANSPVRKPPGRLRWRAA
jgi:AraC family transcriptional regulator of adaptative response / DNA-3-methyladenine glycosylase II